MYFHLMGGQTQFQFHSNSSHLLDTVEKGSNEKVNQLKNSLQTFLNINWSEEHGYTTTEKILGYISTGIYIYVYI